MSTIQPESYFSPITPATALPQFVKPPTYSQRAASSENVNKTRKKAPSLNLGRFVERFSVIAIPIQSADSITLKHSSPPFSTLIPAQHTLLSSTTVPIQKPLRQTWLPTRPKSFAPPIANDTKSVSGLRRLQLCPWEADDAAEKGNTAPQTKNRRICTPNRSLSVLLALVATLLVANILVIDYKVLPVFSESVVVFDSFAGASTAGGATSSNYATCVSLFELTANSEPTSYPCRSCIPILSIDPDKSRAAVAALQFCALADIYTATSDPRNASRVGGVLNEGRWMSDAQYCSWSGITCDSDQRVANLSLTAPAVPASLSATFNLLGSSLTTLSIIGDGKLPAGPFYSSFWPEMKKLDTLHIESTALQATLPDRLFDNLDKLRSYSLIGNLGLSNVAPKSISSSSLETIVLSGQAISDMAAVENIASSSSLQKSLRYLDLSSSGLTSEAPDFSKFASLQSLSLANNNLSDLSEFPSSLTSLYLDNIQL